MSAAEEIPPDPAALFETMRAFGYSLPTAIADLVDNSITARARAVTIRFRWAGPRSTVTVLDDGTGMDQPTLVAAMRAGSRNPTEQRPADDLGRFGLGLKSAAWSQARDLTVITRHALGPVLLRRWSLDHVTRTKRWELLDEGSPAAEELAAELAASTSGTAVLLESADRLVGDAAPDDERARARFYADVATVRAHLGVVFHRFLSGRDPITITVNDLPITGWDPFLESDHSSQQLQSESLWVDHRRIDVTPFVLPHQSRLSDADHQTAGGLKGWTEQQGFYVYRARRLLVAGGWLGLPRMRREEHLKLARVRVDLDSSMDQLWQIDVRKATARIPGSLQPDLERIARAVRSQAADVYRFRGKQEARRPGTASSLQYVWQPVRTRQGRVFRVNREHPAIAALLQEGQQPAAVEAALRLAEEHIPIEAIVMLASEDERDTAQRPFDGRDREVDALLRSTVEAMAATGLDRLAALEAIHGVEPFDEFPELTQTLRQELSL